MMTARRKALLEAALLCSLYADNPNRSEDAQQAARQCARIIEDLANSPVHSYPPGKPVIDDGQDSENSS